MGYKNYTLFVGNRLLPYDWIALLPLELDRHCFVHPIYKKNDALHMKLVENFC